MPTSTRETPSKEEEAVLCFCVPREVVRWVMRKLCVDEWLIRTVMALSTEACTVVRTDARLSESFLSEGWFASRVSPLLFTAVMDGVSSEAGSGLPSKLRLLMT